MDFEAFGTDGHEDDLPRYSRVADSTSCSRHPSIVDSEHNHPYASAPLFSRDYQRDTARSSDAASTVAIDLALAEEGARLAAAMPFPVAYTRELQRTDELLEAIADWRAHTGAERGRDRRWALRLLAAERRRRDASRAALHAAAQRAA